MLENWCNSPNIIKIFRILLYENNLAGMSLVTASVILVSCSSSMQEYCVYSSKINHFQIQDYIPLMMVFQHNNVV
jgi:hypothetical protein